MHLGRRTKQYCFNAKTGEPATGDPGAGSKGPQMPFGFESHQLAKAVHRGSYFGILGRILDFLAGFALLYLSINGLALFIDFRKTRKAVAAAGTVAG